MVTVVEKMKLAMLRTELLLTQTELAEISGVERATINRCEQGRFIRPLTAKKILKGLNKKRKEAGKEAIQPTDIDWNIKN